MMCIQLQSAAMQRPLASAPFGAFSASARECEKREKYQHSPYQVSGPVNAAVGRAAKLGIARSGCPRPLAGISMKKRTPLAVYELNAGTVGVVGCIKRVTSVAREREGWDLHHKGECSSSCLNLGVVRWWACEGLPQYGVQRLRQCIVGPGYIVDSHTPKVSVGAVRMNALENPADPSGIFRCNFAPDPQCDKAGFGQALGEPGGKRTTVHAEKESAELKQSMGRVHKSAANRDDTASGEGARPSEQGSRMLKAISSAWSGKPLAGRN